MTAREAMQAVGKTGALQLGPFAVSVKILDVREVYGRVNFLVTPIAGEGQAWKAETSVKVQKGGKA